MKKIFARAWQKFVKSVVLYSNADDAVLYYDPEHANPVPSDELIELFNKGLIEVDNSSYNLNEVIRPISMSNEAAYVSLRFITGSSSGADISLIELHSKEYADNQQDDQPDSQGV